MKTKSKQKNIPDGWIGIKLGETFLDIRGGGTPSKKVPEYWGGEIPWATVKDISSFSPRSTQDYITKEGLKNSSSRLVPAGTMIMPTRMLLGVSVFFDVDVAINQDLKAISFKAGYCKEFIHFWVVKNSLKINKMGIGSTVSGISQDDLKSIKLLCPPFNEQKRIVAILETWDEYCEKLERKIEIKKNIKKGLMQQLLTGKKRLKGFGGKWKKVELGSLLNYEQPNKYIVSDTNYSNVNKMPVLTAGKSFILGYTDEKDGIYSKVPVIIFDDFTVANKYVTFPFKVKSSAMKMLKIKDDNATDLKFVYEMMQIIRFATSEHKRKYLSEYQYIAINFPLKKEQVAIANILTQADEEVEALKKKKKIIEDQKKYLLNNLITGKIRTPENMKEKA